MLLLARWAGCALNAVSHYSRSERLKSQTSASMEEMSEKAQKPVQANQRDISYHEMYIMTILQPQSMAKSSFIE